MSTMRDFDLNQEPLDLATGSVVGLGLAFSDGVESTCNEVEERIRLLEIVYARARWRQTRHPPQNALGNEVDEIHNEGQGVVEMTKGVKRDSSHLVAKALKLDMGVFKVVGDGQGFFDCNICLGTVRDPVLTCCGHLFCWACFYMLPYIYSTAKECPVCKGEILDSYITPIYGNGKGAHALESDYGVKIPPRPRANRVENVRRNRLTNRTFQIPVADALRHVRVGISGPAGRHVPPPTTDVLVGGGSRRHRSRLIARALAEADAPFPSNTDPGMFSSGESLPVLDDVAAAETNYGSSVGFLLESPVPEISSLAESAVNESQPSSSSRRRNREPRGRRRRQRS